MGRWEWEHLHLCAVLLDGRRVFWAKITFTEWHSCKGIMVAFSVHVWGPQDKRHKWETLEGSHVRGGWIMRLRMPIFGEVHLSVDYHQH